MTTPADIRKLRDLAGSTCSFPECRSRDSLQEAHIAGRQPGSKRHDPKMPVKVRDSYANLILLCSNHHLGVIDRPDATYTVDELHAMKRRHETIIASTGGSISELAGEVHASGTDAESVIGADLRRPTRIAPGSRITAEGNRVRNVTGLRIGGDDVG